MVAWYIRRHRDRLAGAGVALSDADRAWLGEYFSAQLLHSVRVVVRDPLPIAVPPFAGFAARRLGFLAVESIAAITFDHVIAARQPMPRRTLFHELVHVAQFRLLGVGAFSRLYARGFLRSGNYEGIPLERCAYKLEDWFAEGRAFSVEAEVLEVQRDW